MTDQPTVTPPGKDNGSQEPGGLVKFWQELRRRKVVRVAIAYAAVGWLIVEVASATFGSFGIPEWAFRFVTLMVVLGFPLAVILSWAFDLTPDGIKTTKSAQAEQGEVKLSETQQKKRNWTAYVMGAALPTLIFGLLAVYFYVTRSGDNGGIDVGEKSIAVLPLDNFSPDPNNAHFASGVHEDILTHLSHIKSLRVIARTSVMRYRETDMSVKEIAEELGVRYVLEGSVRKAGDLIKVTVQLIDSLSEGHLWADDYERRLTVENVFKIQEEISLAVADSMRAEISPEEQQQLEKLPTQNMAALEAYFKGKNEPITRPGLETIVEYYEEAISLDPDFALAYAELAAVQVELTSRSGRLEWWDKAEENVKKALELNNHLGEAHYSFARLRRNSNPESAIVACRTALEINPNDAQSLRLLGELIGDKIGIASEAAELFRKSYHLDPKSSFSPRALSDSLFYSGQREDSIKPLEMDAFSNPNSANAHFNLGSKYRRLGRYDDAITAFRKKVALDTAIQSIRIIGQHYRSLGDNKTALWWYRKYAQVRPYVRAWDRMEQAIVLGDDELKRQATYEQSEYNPIFEITSEFLLDFEIADGDLGEARAKITQFAPNLLDSDVEIIANNLQEAIQIARVLTRTGEGTHAKQLLQKVLARLDLMHQDYDHESYRAVAYALLEDEAKVLTAIRNYFDLGGSPYDLELKQELKPYFDHPEYVAMAEKRKAELAIQLNRIRKMEAAGELAPIPEHLRD